MARRRASMREGPLAELFRATEAAQKQAEQRGETEQPPPEDAATAAPEAPAEPENLRLDTRSKKRHGSTPEGEIPRYALRKRSRARGRRR